MFNKSLFFFYIFVITHLECKAQAENSTECVCVPFFQCSDDNNNNVISDGRGLIEVRKYDILQQECPGHFDVHCCYNTSFTSASMNNYREKEQVLIKPQGCDYQQDISNTSLVWRSYLLFKQFPQFTPSYKCRVSLIHPKVAVTAAHCIDEKGIYIVKISNIARVVGEIFIHTLFKKASLQNDIALLVLNKAFPKIIKKAAIVCLPHTDNIMQNIDNCTTVTWTQNDRKTYKVIELPVVTKENCIKYLRTTRLGQHFQLHDSFICAGGSSGHDTCNGDGGSPLICSFKGSPYRHQQVGIVSWGIGCGEAPGIYVNLAHFRSWIDQMMTDNNFS